MLLLWWRRRILHGILIGLVFLAASGVLWGTNALTSGEFNYQGGDRKTFYGTFPFDRPESAWTGVGNVSATNDSDADNVLQPSEFVNRFSHNVEYFLLGRHSGFVPYFFPGFVGLIFWLASRERTRAWRWLSFLGAAAAVGGLLVFAPYSWNGGGGPPGNPILPEPVSSILLSDAAARISGRADAGMDRRCVVHRSDVDQSVHRREVHVLDDRTRRGTATAGGVDDGSGSAGCVVDRADPRSAFRTQRSSDAFLFPGSECLSTRGRSTSATRHVGRRRATRRHHGTTEDPTDYLAVTAESPIHTTLTVSMGAATVAVPIVPGKLAYFNVPASGVRGLNSFAYLLSATSSDGFTPHLLDRQSSDSRNLGVLMRFQAVSKPANPK